MKAASLTPVFPVLLTTPGGCREGSRIATWKFDTFRYQGTRSGRYVIGIASAGTPAGEIRIVVYMQRLIGAPERRAGHYSQSGGRVAAAVAMVLSLMPLRAADIEGTVTIMRRLTKPKVTAAANSYARGMAVALHSDISKDVLAFERSHVVVYLEGALPSAPLAGAMEQKDRQFIPDMLVLPVGSTVSFPNLDPIFHNVFSLSKPKEFDLGNYPKDQTRTVTFSKTGIVFVNCHLHSNMGAVIVITPNQWNSRVDGAGRFRLCDVPAGTYTIVAWHKAAGYFRQRVTVSGNGGTPLSFFIPLVADAAEAAR
jgi:plastocyanin